jgi:twitching motility protein PilT
MLKSQFDYIIGQVLSRVPQTSDIIFTVGKPVQAEVDGEFKEIKVKPDIGPLVPWQVESMAASMMGTNLRHFRDLVQQGSCDLSYEVRGRGRFRVNIFSQKGSLAIVMRKLPEEVPTAKKLGLPEIFEKMAQEKYGLLLVTGATGTGKSTSLAALINAINSDNRKHIVTLEDPIEFVHPHKAGVVNQREMGVDFDAFSSGLRAALRQAPDIILVGEIRDRETLTIALEAAETGHLVLGTLHTGDAAQTINRIIGMFELSEERFIRGRLSESLKYVVSQRLMPKKDGGKIAAFEVLVNNLRIRELIMNGEDGEKNFYEVLHTSSAYGMNTFDDYLFQLYQEGVVSESVAMLHASEKARLGQMLDKLKAEQGEKVTDIDGLELDEDYDQRIQEDF